MDIFVPSIAFTNPVLRTQMVGSTEDIANKQVQFLKLHKHDLSLSAFVLAYQSNGIFRMQGHRYSYIMTYYLCYTK